MLTWHVQINFSQHSTYIQIVFCSKVSIYTQNSIQYEHTLTLIQYCFQGQNEVDPLLMISLINLSMRARFEWNFECISFKEEHSLGLLVKSPGIY